MSPIQLILTTALLMLFIAYLVKMKSNLMYRLFFCFLIIIGVLFSIFPEVTNKIAHRMGVGRGADLILYLSLLGIAFLFLLVYSKLKKIEINQTEIIRLQAIEKARILGQK